MYHFLLFLLLYGGFNFLKPLCKITYKKAFSQLLMLLKLSDSAKSPSPDSAKSPSPRLSVSVAPSCIFTARTAHANVIKLCSSLCSAPCFSRLARAVAPNPHVACKTV